MFFELLPFWGGWLILVNQGQQENDQSCNHFSLFHMFDHVQWSDSSLYGSDRPLCKEEIYITSVIHTLGWWSFIAPPFNEIHQHVKIDNGFLLYSNFLHKHSISHKASLQGVCLDQVFARPLREGSSLKLEILSVCFSAAMTQCQLRVHLFCVPPAGICEGIIKTPLPYHPQYKLRLPPSPSLFGSFSPISKKLRTSTVINCAFISVCLSIVLEYMGFVVTVVPFIPFLQWRISMSSIVANITINVRPLKGGT